MAVSLFCKQPWSELHHVEADAGQTMLALMARVAKALGIDAACFSLKFDGVVLNESDFVGDHPFQDGSEVQVVISKRHMAFAKLAELSWREKGPEELVGTMRRLHTVTDIQHSEADKKLSEVISAMSDAGLCGDRQVMAELFLLASCRDLVLCLVAMLESGVVCVDDQPEGYNSHTALLHAAYYNKREAAAVLLDYKADPGVKNRFGQTALDYAQTKGHAAIVELLV